VSRVCGRELSSRGECGVCVCVCVFVYHADPSDADGSHSKL